MKIETSRQKKLTTDFFNKVSDEWWERTYDPSGRFLKFPSNRVRLETALAEIDALHMKGRMLDIGCGTGQLVIELLKRRHDAVGIDIAADMVAASKENLMEEGLQHEPESVFRTLDIAEVPAHYPRSNFNVVLALGLLEYLERDEELFGVLNKMLKRGSYVLVDCRNKFFNLFSLNRYTAALASSGELPVLLEKLGSVGKYSPRGTDELPFIQKDVTKEVFHFLSANVNNKKWLRARPPSYSSYPQKMVRRQHIPQELETSGKKFGFALERVVYWHAHPYPPALEGQFPAFYNKLSYLMAPLGYTPLGAWMCSSFLAVLKKK